MTQKPGEGNKECIGVMHWHARHSASDTQDSLVLIDNS